MVGAKVNAEHEKVMAALEKTDGVEATKRKREEGEQDFEKCVQVRPYGCLGSQLTLAKEFVDKGGLPDKDTAFVDPAGLEHIHGEGKDGPRGAEGAAGQIYKTVGLKEAERFPDKVRESIKAEGQACYQSYAKDGSTYHVVHVVGPDLRTEKPVRDDDGKVIKYEPILVDGQQKVKPTREEAVSVLSTAYSNVFLQFLETPLPRLRLLPISGGIFLGDYKPEIEQLTVESVRAAFERLTEEQQQVLCRRSVDMCIFMEAELDGFRRAFLQE